MPDLHTEIERKFDVATDFGLPDLTGVDGVSTVGEPEERLLEAVYHDSADLRLARARVTLRRRTGGPDAGWHVKLPAGGDARTELHFPLGRASRTPPRAVLAPVTGLVRTATVGPVATLRTRRCVTLLQAADGRVLAEVADDTVTGTALSADPGQPAVVQVWREVEVELVGGDEALLEAVAARLLAAGARPAASASKLARTLGDRLAALEGPAAGNARTTTGKGAGKAPTKAPTKKAKQQKAAAQPTAAGVALAALRGQLADLQEADLRVRTGHPDGVHDVRVACRRLRSSLRAFRAVLDRERTDPLRTELQEFGTRLSAARDGEVALAHLRELAAGQPAELLIGPVAARLQQAQLKDAEAGRRAAARALADPRYLRLLDALFAVLDDPPLTPQATAPAEPVLTAAVRGAGRRLHRRVAQARDAGPDADLHAVRKAVKRVRYTAEAAAAVLGRPAAELVDRMKSAQEVLGARQDTVVTRELARRIGLAAAAAGENAWTYGRLHALEEARAAAAEDAFWRLEPSLRRALRAARKG